MPPSISRGHTSMQEPLGSPHTFSSAASFRVFSDAEFASGLRHDCSPSAQTLLANAPSLAPSRCHPGQSAVRDSHVISLRQTHDLRQVVSRIRHRIRFMAAATFGLRCSIDWLTRQILSTTNDLTRRLAQGFLLGSGTHTRRYTLKLSKDLTIAGECRLIQVSPHNPVSFPNKSVPLQYTFMTRPFGYTASAYVPSSGCAVRISNAP